MRGSAKSYFPHFLWISANSKQEFFKKSFSSFVEFEYFCLKQTSWKFASTEVCDRHGKNLRTGTDNPSLTRCYDKSLTLCYGIRKVSHIVASTWRCRCYPEELCLNKFPKDFDYSSIDLTLFGLGFFGVPGPGGGASKAPPPSTNPKVLMRLTWNLEVR